ncbi:MAG: ABC transporter substrate-binding protein, partial [Candidatus Tectomicrobia bacterium]|nr:ABC transporter substrate-binding protein [Candidatus Tectomicrobia bacterium]
WEIVGDGAEYIFKLHENVKFHDGTDCDAEAVKWNFDDMIKRGKKSWVYVYFNQMDSAEVVDKSTIKVKMKEPAALLPALAGYFGGVPIGSPTAVEKYGEEWNRNPVGAGAFTYDINDYRPDEKIILKKNPNYFKPGLPYLDEIQISVIKDPLAAMTALRTKQIDFLQRVNPQHVPIIERAKGVVLETAPERMPLVCFMNMRKPPFDDVRVRQAIGGFGLDRKQIAQTVFQNRATPLVSILPPGVQDYLDLNELYPYDPEKAKALLAEAGHGPDNPVEFELILNNDAPFFSDAATLMKSQYEKIGVKMKLTMMDKPAWLDRFLGKHEYQMAMEDFGALVDINQRSVSFFRGAKSNYGGLESPEIEDLTMKWRREPDEAKRKEIAHDIQRTFAKDMLWCNVTGSPYFQAYQDYVKGYHFMNQLYVRWETTWLNKA